MTEISRGQVLLIILIVVLGIIEILANVVSFIPGIGPGATTISQVLIEISQTILLIIVVAFPEIGNKLLAMRKK